MSKNRFYVYLHRRATDGSIFYVGKGSGGRAWYFHDRFEWWTRVKNKHGVIVDICQSEMREEDAYLLEMWLIAKFRHGGTELTNATDGGDAPPRWQGANHPNYDPSIIRLVHLETGEKFEGTQNEFLKRYATTQGNFSSFLSGKFKSHKGWIRQETDPSTVSRCGKNHPAYDPTIYHLENLDGRKFSGNRYEFRERHNIGALQINAFLRGRQHTLHGWFRAELKGKLPPGNVGKFNNHHDPQVFKFEHKDGEIFLGTGLDLCEQRGATPSGVHCIKSGRYATHAGWRIAGAVV